MLKWIIAAAVVVTLTILYVRYAKANPYGSKATGVISGQRTIFGKLTTRATSEIQANPTARKGLGHF